MATESFRCQPGSLRDVDVRRVPALDLHTQRSMRVLRHRFHGNAAHFVKRRAANHCARAAEEGRIPEIIAVLHNSIEKFAFVGNRAELIEVALERIGGIKVVRRL